MKEEDLKGRHNSIRANGTLFYLMCLFYSSAWLTEAHGHATHSKITDMVT